VTPAVTVVDDNNATGTASASLTVQPPNSPPDAALEAPSNATAGEEVVLDASGSTDDNGITEYRWDFDGDGNVDTNATSSATVTHVYDDAGTTRRQSPSLIATENSTPPTPR